MLKADENKRKRASDGLDDESETKRLKTIDSVAETRGLVLTCII